MDPDMCLSEAKMRAPRGGARPVASAATAGLFLWLAAAGPLRAQAPPLMQPDVTCEIDLEGRAEHIATITITFSGLDRDILDLRFPLWTTGGRVRRSGDDLMELTATGPERLPLRIRRLGPEHWQVDVRGVAEPVIHYRIWANDPSPRGAQVNTRHAYLNPAAVLLYPPQLPRMPVTVRFRIPSSWKVASTLEPTFDPTVFRAADFLEVFEAPFEAAAFEERFFTVRGMNVTLVTHDPPSGLDRAALLQGLERLLDQAVNLFGVVPASDHLFVFHFQGEGTREAMGLPAATSVQWGLPLTGNGMDELLRTTLEGFLHAWLGGRIRPGPMLQAFLTDPFVTDSYWFLDGAAAYYTELLAIRAGRARPERLQERLGREITRLQNTAARSFRSAAESSLGLWDQEAEGWRSPQRGLDHRGKGLLLCFQLDLEIRRATANRRSLDDLMSLLAGWFGRSGRAFDESADLLLAAGALARTDLTSFLDQYVYGTVELPYEEALGVVGWTLRTVTAEVARAGFEAEPEGKETLRIASVVEGSPAARAGLRAGDRIMAINGSSNLAALNGIVELARPGDILTLRVRRAGREEEISFPLSSGQAQVFRVESSPTPTPQQQAVALSLFGGPG
jgi:predicted metalloprotease with PDZ domain